MSQSLSKMWSHLIFSTKDRYPFLSDQHTREELHAYMAGILRKHDCPTPQVGGVIDHIHAMRPQGADSGGARFVQESISRIPFEHHTNPLEA